MRSVLENHKPDADEMFVPLLRCRFHILLVLTLPVTSATCLSAQTAKKPPTKISFEIGRVPSWVKPIAAVTLELAQTIPAWFICC